MRIHENFPRSYGLRMLIIVCVCIRTCVHSSMQYSLGSFDSSWVFLQLQNTLTVNVFPDVSFQTTS
jgi:hypothetical protein